MLSEKNTKAITRAFHTVHATHRNSILLDVDSAIRKSIALLEPIHLVIAEDTATPVHMCLCALTTDHGMGVDGYQFTSEITGQPMWIVIIVPSED